MKHFHSAPFRVCAISIIDYITDKWTFDYILVPERERQTLDYMREAGYSLWNSLPDKKYKEVVIHDVGSTYHFKETTSNTVYNFAKIWDKKYYYEWSREWSDFNGKLCDAMNDRSMGESYKAVERIHMINIKRRDRLYEKS